MIQNIANGRGEAETPGHGSTKTQGAQQNSTHYGEAGPWAGYPVVGRVILCALRFGVCAAGGLGFAATVGNVLYRIVLLVFSWSPCRRLRLRVESHCPAVGFITARLSPRILLSYRIFRVIHHIYCTAIDMASTTIHYRLWCGCPSFGRATTPLMQYEGLSQAIEPRPVPSHPPPRAHYTPRQRSGADPAGPTPTPPQQLNRCRRRRHSRHGHARPSSPP